MFSECQGCYFPDWHLDSCSGSQEKVEDKVWPQGPSLHTWTTSGGHSWTSRQKKKKKKRVEVACPQGIGILCWICQFWFNYYFSCVGQKGWISEIDVSWICWPADKAQFLGSVKEIGNSLGTLVVGKQWLGVILWRWHCNNCMLRTGPMLRTEPMHCTQTGKSSHHALLVLTPPSPHASRV